jgi:hypothetical protein
VAEPRKYRKKPVEVEAIRFDGTNQAAIAAWMGIVNYDPNARLIHIATLEGVMAAQPGDWIIRGVEGEFYPCKPAIFQATYEEVTAPVEWSVAARAELARMRAQVATEIAEAIEDDGFGGECCAVYERCAEIARQHAAPSGSPGNPADHPESRCGRCHGPKYPDTDPFEDGAVLRFEKTFPGNEKSYTYVAHRVNGRWYVSGLQTPQGISWDKFVDFMGIGVKEVWRINAPKRSRGGVTGITERKVIW